ncbi:MAG: F0F1 ATP synthase subunit delta [Nanoarchaeota archaeon]|nr:F0F1 ATP synthase subunit delta [Nanoarchaeota archaeon]
MEKYFKELTEKIRTKEELIFFLEEISKVGQIIFKDKEVSLSKKIEGKVSGELKKFLERLEKEGVISGSQERQSAFLEKLGKELQSLPEIKLEIAFSPDDDFLNKISQWFEKELGQKIILDLTINPKVIGGAIAEYRGNWRDFSLAKEINQLISQNARF